MRQQQDILSLVRAKDAQATRESQRGVILQPGALGDCILTLPLARLMKGALKLGGVDLIGHAEYIDFLPGRSCIDSIRSIDSTDLHRLFVDTARFDLEDRDPLIGAFADYAWIVTFLGEIDGDFERNLIFTANCSHSAEVCTLSMKPPTEAQEHLAMYYAKQFVDRAGLPPTRAKVSTKNPLIRATKADRDAGRELLRQEGLDPARRLIVLHPGSGGRHKCWHIENFTAMTDPLRSMGYEVLFLLGPAEMERLSDTDMNRILGTARCVTNRSVAQVVSLLSCAYAFVGNDSGVTHLAAGMGRRTVALFGPTDPAQYAPIGPALRVFRDPHDRFAREPCPDMREAVFDAFEAWAKR